MRHHVRRSMRTLFAAVVLPRTRGTQPIPAVALVRRSVGAALFMSLWMAAIPRAAARIAVGRGPLRYEGTPHVPDAGR